MLPMQLPYTRNYSGTCPECSFVLPALSEVSGFYFATGSIKCSHCGISLDLWKTTLDYVIRLVDFTTSLSALGPQVTNLEFRVSANEVVELDFTKFGIPETATILWVNYSPHDNCLPIEWHGNTPPRRFRGTRVNLYGVQTRTSDGVPNEATIAGDNLGVMILWAPAGQEDLPWLYLVDAIEAVSLGRFSQAIVPAHTAAEISITPIIRPILVKYSSQKYAGRFLGQELSFSSTMNVVLPLICALVDAKPLPDEIRAKLNSLRKLRNKFVHDGVLPTAVDAKEIRTLLCAAAFSLEYAKYLKGFI